MHATSLKAEAMNTDIRLLCTFPGHPKTVKLRRRLGAEGPLALIYLWAYCGEYRPDGRLTNMDAEDIAIAAQWEGEPEHLINELLALHFLDRDPEGVLLLHDWAQHNAYAAHAPQRSASAQRNARLKWGLDDTNREKRSQRLAAARQRGRHTREEWAEMVSFFGETCVRCESGKGLAGVVKDHIVPVYQGGSDAINNLQPLCARCNASKGPEGIDFRLHYCHKHGLEMPAKWHANACETPAERLPNACETPATQHLTSAPSPIPSPSPSPIPDIERTNVLLSTANVDQKETTANGQIHETRTPPCPYQVIVDLFHRTLPELPTVLAVDQWTDARRRLLQARWRQLPDARLWEQFFHRVRGSKFLMGQVTPNDKMRKPFQASLSWLIRPENFAKVLEGFYR